MAQATPTTSVIGGGMQGSDRMVWEAEILNTHGCETGCSYALFASK